jgi:hypothetical protein
MIVSEFTYLLQNPGHVDPGQTAELEKVLEAYPYFQAAAAIHLKGLKNLESFKYNQELKKPLRLLPTALYFLILSPLKSSDKTLLQKQLQSILYI